MNDQRSPRGPLEDSTSMPSKNEMPVSVSDGSILDPGIMVLTDSRKTWKGVLRTAGYLDGFVGDMSDAGAGAMGWYLANQYIVPYLKHKTKLGRQLLV